ncbi:hypothetical protein IOC61_16510 [Halomonas sp. KAO]|uniref:hypothetical protein n=1 Tax=unclassified Halomonas TaxID=2609666 RepID=UPI0018A0926B|nr:MULTISPECIES: hypothetical protein [unclassified Halomonas]MBF7054903.1 hypothetical protein [Halomonas sp. KAO]MDT0501500.1 hypothetical protein [Halomonas sp. PAR7]MDT0512818.1 hypothetical protein [Halomonas sp. LES1]MDT0591357.1 hypothetical protein [Halomonas sp. PAR8]
MPPTPVTGERRRRGATRRRHSAARYTRFDRWLDRLVVLAVIIALVVGGSALIVSLVL